MTDDGGPPFEGSDGSSDAPDDGANDHDCDLGSVDACRRAPSHRDPDAGSDADASTNDGDPEGGERGERE